MSRFLFSVLITSFLVYFLSTKTGDIPPLGKILDPFNGFWQNAEADPLELDLLLSIPQLQDEVNIQFESNLIPHIYASNEYDLYFSQGYLTAYHRLWQMEFITMVASGRVSEVLGKRAINFDRLQRRKGLADATEKTLQEIEKLEDVFNSVKAYADGVNAYIDQLDYGMLPVEYKVMDYYPEKWSPYKSLLIQKYLADNLNSDRDLKNTNMVLLFGKERFDFLFPDVPDNIEPIIPIDTKWDFQPLDIFTPDTFEIMNTISYIFHDSRFEGIGSNNWAVHGSMTKNGHAILCNDPHLGLNLPMVWYAQQLAAPGINVYGVTVPGVPGIILGLNDSVAWGMTNADRDLRDWYEITFRDDSYDEYLYGGKWLKTQKRIETIQVRGQDNFTDTVVYTHYGPVVYDNSYMGDSISVNFALKWTLHNPSKEIQALYELNRARNLEESLEAVSYWDNPPQNFAIATRQGNIAQVVQGNYPLKWKEQGKFIMDGSDPAYEWQGYIPTEHNARVINPERGFISSANQHPFTEDYPYYYYSRSDEQFRNRRINQVLGSMKDAGIEEMKSLQNDNYFTLASMSLPVMLDSLNELVLSDDQKGIVRNLKDWNYMADAQTTEPSYFHTWWIKLYGLLWDEFDVDFPVEKPSAYTTAVLLTEYPSDSAFDRQSTEEVEHINDIVTAAFLEAVDSVEAWTEEHQVSDPLWYLYKDTRLTHMTRIESFSYSQIPIGGYKGIVNATAENWGASWRLVAEMGEQIEAWGIYPGGQSGNPGSPAYGSFIDDWAKGNYFRINFWGTYQADREDVTNIVLSRQVIKN